MQTLRVAPLLLMFASFLLLPGNQVAVAESTHGSRMSSVTIDGQTYYNARMTSSTAERVTIIHSDGIASFVISELSRKNQNLLKSMPAARGTERRSVPIPHKEDAGRYPIQTVQVDREVSNSNEMEPSSLHVSPGMPETPAPLESSQISKVSNSQESWNAISKVIIIASYCVAIFILAAAYSLRCSMIYIQKTPTSNAAEITEGLVELQGVAKVAREYTHNLNGHPCVHHSMTVEEHWTKTTGEWVEDTNGERKWEEHTESGWEEIFESEFSPPFFLKDSTGEVLIHPEGADIETDMASTNIYESDDRYYEFCDIPSLEDSDGKRRFVEAFIQAGKPMLVLGYAKSDDYGGYEIVGGKHAKRFFISVGNEKDILSENGMAAAVTRYVYGPAAFIVPSWILYFASKLSGDNALLATTFGAMLYIGAWVLFHWYYRHKCERIQREVSAKYGSFAPDENGKVAGIKQRVGSL